MKKAATDPKVKKTLIRNYEQKISTQRKGIYDVGEGSSNINKNTINKNVIVIDHNLDEPKLCSSELLTNYLSDVRKSVPPLLSSEDLNIDRSQVNAKITKKLNFHFNDKIYKNLVELNTDAINIHNKQDKKVIKSKAKKDLEPSIEDFYQDEKQPDILPEIPILKRNITTIKGVENERLHRLVAAFENL